LLLQATHPAEQLPPPELLMVLLLVCSSVVVGIALVGWLSPALSAAAAAVVCCLLCFVKPVCCAGQGLRDAKLVAATHYDGRKQPCTNVLQKDGMQRAGRAIQTGVKSAEHFAD
jgi:hypothetical protein